MGLLCREPLRFSLVAVDIVEDEGVGTMVLHSSMADEKPVGLTLLVPCMRGSGCSPWLRSVRSAPWALLLLKDRVILHGISDLGVFFIVSLSGFFGFKRVKVESWRG